MALEKEINNRITSLFNKPDQPAVMSLLESITLQHVMAESPENLKNARLAVLHLSKGDLHQLEVYVNAAKKDFRDVIYWLTLEQDTNPNT